MTKNNLKVVKSTKDKELENKEKNKALDAAISQITDNFGKGSVMRLGEQKAMDVESISTGSLSLDLALGIGGLPNITPIFILIWLINITIVLVLEIEPVNFLNA